MSIFIFIISLIVLIMVHELGHFSAAKIFKVRVDEFGLGLPPKVWGKRIGETIYSINWIPFGGFVKIFGENADDEIKEGEENRNFQKKPGRVQAIILIAGVLFNFLFAWLLLSIGFMSGMPTPVGSAYGSEVSDPQVTVVSVLPNSPASKAGLQVGDSIVSLEGLSKDLSPEIVSNITTKSHNPLDIVYKRGPKTFEVNVTPEEGIVSGKMAIGISMEMIGILKLPIHKAFYEGLKTTSMLTYGTAQGLISFITKTIFLKSNLSEISGPVGIANIFSQASGLGISYIISMVALISVNLAVINLIPFPALDGGRLLFVAIEGVIRKPIHLKFVTVVNTIGFFLLLTLMVVVTVHDILRLV